MKIVTWNINGYRSITGQNPSKRHDLVSTDNKLFKYIEQAQPDIICLQETKASVEQIAKELLYPVGYNGTYFSAQKLGYSGVATFTKNEIAVTHKSGFGIEMFDSEGRVIVSNHNNFILLNVYFPNGKKDDLRLEYKLNFYKKLFQFTEELRKTQPNIIICGDYNTAHHPIDLAHPKQNEKVSGFLPVERAELDNIVTQGHVDVFRYFNKEPNQYTWWSNLGNSREKNVGWRIDYFFVTENLLKFVADCYIQPEVMGSDHCPIVLELNNV